MKQTAQVKQTKNKPSSPLVSIIMPARNAEKYLSQAIESFLNQTYPNKELILIDDGSRDSTLTIAVSYSKSHPQIKVYKNQTSQGIASTRNQALALTQGKYIGHLDADDQLHPQAITKALQLLQSKKNLALVYSGYYTINKQNNITDHYLAPPFSTQNLSQLGWQHFGMYRKSIALRIGGFNENLITCSDGDFFMRLAQKYPCQRINKYLYYYRWHATNIGHQRPHCFDCPKQPICEYFKVWNKENKTPY